MYNLLLKWADPIGMIGVTLLLIAYFLLSAGKWSSRDLCYQIFNGLGAALILFSLFFHWNLSAVVIEVVWIMISLMGICRILRTKYRKTSASIHGH